MRNFKINKYEILFILLIFPFIRLEAFLYITLVDKLYDILKLFNFLLIVLLEIFTIIFRQKGKINKFSLKLLFLITIIFVSVFFHKENMLIFFIRYISLITLPLIVDYADRRNKLKELLSGSSKFFKILILLNFLGVIFFPNGIWQDIRVREGMLESMIVPVHLLGKANAIAPSLLSMSAIILLNTYVRRKSFTIKEKVIHYVTYISIILQKSATGIIGLLIYFMLIFAYRNMLIKKILKKCRISYSTFLYLATIGTIAVCVFNIQNYFASFITLVLKKDITLSNRINVWYMYIEYVKKNFTNFDFLIGKGLIEYSKPVFNGRYAHCHNQFMDMFLQGGIIAVLLYIDLFKSVLVKISKLKKEKFIYLVAVLISFIIMFIAEVYISPLIYFTLYLIYFNYKNLMLYKNNIGEKR